MPESRSKQSPISAKSLAQVLGLAVVYLAAARLGFLAAPAHQAVSSVWPPAGIAVAALLVFGPRIWPGITLGALLANLTATVAWPAALAIGVGNTLEALTAFWVCRRLGFGNAMDRLRDVLVLAGAALLATTISASIGVVALQLAGDTVPGYLDLLFFTWWTGDAIGILVVAPLIVTVAARPWRVSRDLLEPTLLVLGLGLLTVVVVGTPFPFVYPVFPLAGLAAYRMGPRGAAAANVTVATVTAFFTVEGSGSFILAGGTPTQNLFLFQAFMALLAITTLSAAAVLSERRRAESELRLSEAHLSEAQAIARLGSWRWDTATHHVEWSDELFRIYGLDRDGFTPTMDAYFGRVHPEDRQHVETTIRDALSASGTFELDERIVRPDGAVRILETRGKVLPAEQGRGRTMIGVCQDVTEARQAQITLAASQAKFATMFHASPVAICVIALDKIEVIDANPRLYEMLGNVAKEAVIGRSPRELGMWAEPGELRDLFARLHLQHSVREIPVRYLTREGQERRAVAAVELMEIDGRECAVALFWRP